VTHTPVAEMSLFDKLNHIGGRKTTNEDISIDLKKISKLDSLGNEDAYINTERRRNQNRVKAAMNGVSDLKDLYMLQIRGINQLAKEINEVK